MSQTGYRIAPSDDPTFNVTFNVTYSHSAFAARSEARTENALPAPITLSQTEPTQNWPMPAIPDRFLPLED